MLYMKNFEICAPPGFSLGFEGDNKATSLEISTDLPDGWDLKVDVEKDGQFNVIQLERFGVVYGALLTASMLADDGRYRMQVRGTFGDQVRHSNSFYAIVHDSINAVDQFPPVLPSEFAQMEDRITALNQHPPKPGASGFWMIWNPDKKEYEESDIPLPAGGSGGVSDHRRLTNRDAEDQHPTEAITGLKKEINRIPPPTEAITNSEIEEMLK